MNRAAILMRMAERKVLKKDLALAVDRAQPIVSRWLAGDQVPTIAEATRLARRLAVPLTRFLKWLGVEDADLAPRVDMEGEVGAGAVVVHWEPVEDGETLILPELVDPAGLKAVRILGWSMRPLQPGWILVYRAESWAPSDCVGRLCVVELADGRRLVKEVRAGLHDGTFDLASWSADAADESNVAILKCAPVGLIRTS